MSDAGVSSHVKSASPDPYRALIWSVLLIGCALRLSLLFTTHATEEDFYITLRYAENIAAGHGFVYNAGQHVLGTTTPLYTLLLALVSRLGMDPVLFGKLVGVAADTCAQLFTYRLGRTIGRPVAGLAAAVWLALAPTNLIWSTKGMEVGIVAAVSVASWLAWVQKREALAWIASAVLVLLRIDGAALAVVMFCATVVRDHRIPWRGLAVFVALTAPWFLFATLYFGSPIPLSLGAKLTVYGKLIPGRFPQLVPFLMLMLHNPLGVVLAVGCGLYCVFGFSYWRKLREEGASINRVPELWLIAPLVWIGIHYSGMALSHVVLFGWYFVPPTPIFYLTSMVGISMAAERVGWVEARTNVMQIASAGAMAVTILLGLVVPRVAETLREGQAVETELRIPIGIWIKEHAQPQDTLMLEPIGYIGYYSGLKITIIDVIGLVSPEALPSYRPNVPCPDHDLWQRLRPDWLLLRAGQLKTLTAFERGLAQDQRLDAAYDAANSWMDPAGRSPAPAFVLYRRRAAK